MPIKTKFPAQTISFQIKPETTNQKLLEDSRKKSTNDQAAMMYEKKWRTIFKLLLPSAENCIFKSDFQDVLELDVVDFLKKDFLFSSSLSPFCEFIAGTIPENIPANTLFIVESKITSVEKESKLPITLCPFSKKFSESVDSRFEKFFIPLLSEDFCKNQNIEYNLDNLPNIFLLFVFNGKDPSEPDVKKYYRQFFPCSSNIAYFRKKADTFCKNYFSSEDDKQLGYDLIRKLWEANRINFCVLWCSQSSLDSQETKQHNEREAALIKENQAMKEEIALLRAALEKK